MQFREREIPFGSDPHADAVRKARVLGAKGGEDFAWMSPGDLERTDEGEFGKMFGGEKILEGDGRGDVREPGGAALLHGFDGDLLPLLALGLRAAVVELGDDAFGEERDDVRGSEFNCFLDNALDDLAFGNGNQERP